MQFRFQKRFLVERRLCLDELIADPSQVFAIALREWIVQRFLDCVVGVAPCAVDACDRVADGAGDACLGRGVGEHVKRGVVERTAEEWHRVVAAGTPAGGLDRAVAVECDLAGFGDAGEIHRVVEGAETMGALAPPGMGIGMTLAAVVVVHQRRPWDEVPGGRAGERGLEIRGARIRADGSQTSGVVGVQRHGYRHRGHDEARIGPRHPPADLRSGQPMQPVKPDRRERADHMQPVDHCAGRGSAQVEAADPHEQEAGHKHDDRHGKQCIAESDRPSVAAVPGREEVQRAKRNERRREDQPQHEVAKEHVLVEQVLVRQPREPLERRDAREVKRVGAKKGGQHKDRSEQHPQSWADGWNIVPHSCSA